MSFVLLQGNFTFEMGGKQGSPRNLSSLSPFEVILTFSLCRRMNSANEWILLWHLVDVVVVLNYFCFACKRFVCLIINLALLVLRVSRKGGMNVVYQMALAYNLEQILNLGRLWRITTFVFLNWISRYKLVFATLYSKMATILMFFCWLNKVYSHVRN